MELATETADTNSLDRVLFLWWWRDDNPNDGFGIRVHPVASYIDLTVWVAPGKWEMVTINNNPAILLRGGFPGFDGGFSSEEYSRIYQDAATLEAELFLEVYWVENYFWRLIWTNDGTFYELSATSEALSEADLIRIAESMQ
jgi:hypothetical protein